MYYIIFFLVLVADLAVGQRKPLLLEIDTNITNITDIDKDCRKTKIYNALTKKYNLNGSKMNIMKQHIGEPDEFWVSENNFRANEIFVYTTSNCYRNINGNYNKGEIIIYAKDGEIVETIVRHGGG